MPRTTKFDPIDKFRFKITVLNISASPGSFIQNIGDLNALAFTRGGFSDIKLPSKSTKDLTYRESGDPLHYRKQPGLTSYSDLVLSRGSTTNEDFYLWSTLIKSDALFTSTSSEVLGTLGIDTNKYPQQDVSDYRKDVLVEVLDKTGAVKKSWFLYNCWVKEFNPGGLNAQEEQQVIEQITLVCENMTEFSSDSSEEARVDIINSGRILLNQLGT